MRGDFSPSMYTLRLPGIFGFLTFLFFGIGALQPMARAAGAGEWGTIISSPDPAGPMLDKFRKSLPAQVPGYQPTGLQPADYLKLISSEIAFWKAHQDAHGALIDPYQHAEVQYSTPAYANAAAALVAWDHRDDLTESAAKALDWSVQTLSQRRAASGHEDFFSAMIAHAMTLLKPHVPEERYDKWAAEIKGFDPTKIYRMAPGSMNWNIVSSVGEAFYGQMGLRPDNSYVETSLGAQGRHFTSPHGLYLEGPMAYDLFPRMFLDDLIASGYSGAYSAELREMLRRGAITSLFMQSPWGELPAGGRSAQHNWNEAEQVAVFEIHAAEAARAGDPALASIYKRAAHLSFASIQRWVRPSGELQIVKNWVNPDQRHGYESYSGYASYNLLPMAMLSMAYSYAKETTAIPEASAPADVGGYVLVLPELHKVFANSGGTYVEIDTDGDPHYDATGLIRVQMKGLTPQLTSDSLVAHPAYHVTRPGPLSTNTCIGPQWKDASGNWHGLAEFTTNPPVSVLTSKETPAEVDFTIAFTGNFGSPNAVIEHYWLAPGRIGVTADLGGYAGPERLVFPILADDGRTQTDIQATGKAISVSRPGDKFSETFTADKADSVAIPTDLYPNHDGWSRLGVAEFPNGGAATLVIARKGP